MWQALAKNKRETPLPSFLYINASHLGQSMRVQNNTLHFRSNVVPPLAYALHYMKER